MLDQKQLDQWPTSSYMASVANSPDIIWEFKYIKGLRFMQVLNLHLIL